VASRGELVQMAQELDIEYDDLDIDELTKKVRVEVDKQFNRKFLVGVTTMSTTLLKFILTEYDYRIYDREGNEMTLQKYKEL